MIRNILTLLVVCFVSKFSFSQCSIERWSLEKRMDLSSLVVEGKVIEQYPFRAVGKNAIYTASVIEVYKVFKGTVQSPYYIEIITFGGQIGMERHQANPELELETGDAGIFLLNQNKVNVPDFVKNNGKAKYQGTASVQSVIGYNLDENNAYDIGEVFYGITSNLYDKLKSITGQNYVATKSGFNPDRKIIRPLAGPVITSFTSSATSGTDDVLTVKGTSFGSARGNGRIEFLDANFGDGRRMKTPYTADYKVWTDTQIKVRIPTRAGTGTLKVNTNDSGTYTTTGKITINYAHLNVSFKPTGGNTQYSPVDHYNDNSKGGYTFQFNPLFKAKSAMVNVFLKSLETWRCGTLMNWEVGRDTAIFATNGDGVNLIRLDKFGDSRLAVCYSYYQGCNNGTFYEWSVNELDIEADSSIDWYFGNGTMGNKQFDFQSVLSHELGHGHQLGHVIASSEMMHYGISNGQKKSTLSINDISAGTYVKNKSININVCTGGAMKALTQTACGYTQPVAGFKVNKVSVCPNVSLTFTDTTIGIAKTYLWNFGADASPATANTKGPHTVTYTTEGTKTVKLFASNDFGTDSSVKKNYISVMPGKPAKPTNLKYADTACLGLSTLKVDSTGGTATLTWQLPAQATASSNTKFTKTILWTTSGGPYTFWVKAGNSCGSSDSLIGQSIVLNNPVSSFTKVENGRTVSFTNTSQFAISYKWIFGDGDSTTLVSPVHIYPMGKAYNAKLTAINKCKAVPFSLSVNPFHPSGIDKTDIINIIAYPNPTHDILYLSKDVSSYSLMDATGKIITEGKGSEINLSNTAKGIYILNAHIYNNGANLFIRVVKD